MSIHVKVVIAELKPFCYLFKDRLWYLDADLFGDGLTNFDGHFSWNLNGVFGADLLGELLASFPGDELGNVLALFLRDFLALGLGNLDLLLHRHLVTLLLGHSVAVFVVPMPMTLLLEKTLLSKIILLSTSRF